MGEQAFLASERAGALPQVKQGSGPRDVGCKGGWRCRGGAWGWVLGAGWVGMRACVVSVRRREGQLVWALGGGRAFDTALIIGALEP